LFVSPAALPRILLLTLMATPLFIYHLLGQNIISLQKHLLYSSLFLIPIVACALYQISSKARVGLLQTGVILSALVLYGSSNFQQLHLMKSSFPDVQAVIPFARHIKTTESVLSEDPYLFRYLLHDKVNQAQINETTWLDNNLDGVFEHRDVQHAIWDKKFNYVFLNDQQHKVGNQKLRKMLHLRGYKTLLNQPYTLTTMSGRQRTGVMSLHERSQSEVSMLESD